MFLRFLAASEMSLHLHTLLRTRRRTTNTYLTSWR